MKIFTHINELRNDGFSALRTSVLASERLILWSPSASYLMELNKENSMSPTPEELMWYIKNGNIQIMARDWWIENGDQRKNHRWKFAREWVDKFDGELEELWRKDQTAGRSQHNSRVVVVKEPTGLEWAEDQVNQGKVNVELLAKNAKDSLPGYIERLENMNDDRSIAISLLENARNHGQSFGYSGADRNLGSPADSLLLQILMDSAKETATPIINVFDIDKNISDYFSIIMEVLEIIEKSGTKCRTQKEAFERTQDLLMDKTAVSSFKEWITKSERIAQVINPKFNKTEILNILKQDVRRAIEKSKYHDYLFPKEPLKYFTTVFELVMAGIGVASGSPYAQLSLLPMIVKPAEHLMKYLGYIGSDHLDERWLSYIAYGRSNARINQLEKLL